MPFLTFMSSSAGRATRIMGGLALIAVGFLVGGEWTALAVVGLVPLASGAFDFCVFASLARIPFTGKAFRKRACQT